MSTMATQVARPFTYDDLQQMPDDGYRRELIDGTRLYDLTLKQARYEAAGIVSHWVIDPCIRA